MHGNRFSIIAAINGESIISHVQHKTDLSQELKQKQGHKYRTSRTTRK